MKVTHIGAVLIDADYLVYEIARVGSPKVTAVYDRGVELTPSRDFLTVETLKEAKVTPGRYATCTVSGLIRLGAPADGIVTADVEADCVLHPQYVFRAGDLASSASRDLVGV